MRTIIYFFRPPTLVVLLLFVCLFSNKGSTQCFNPVVYNNWPFSSFDLDLLSNSSQIVFEGFECNPCQWETLPGDFDSNWPNRCECRTWWDNQYDSLYQECMDLCRENFGQFEYNYTLLHNCEQECPWTVLQDIERGKDACGEIPEGNAISNWQFTTLLWYTPNAFEPGFGTRPHDEVHVIGNNTGSQPPK